MSTCAPCNINVAEAKKRIRQQMDKETDSKIRYICQYSCKNNLSGGCLGLTMSLEDRMVFMKPIYEMLKPLTKQEKDAYVIDHIRSCLEFIPNRKNAKCNWKIGEAPGQVLTNVCRECYGNVYGLGHSKIVKIVRDIKALNRGPVVRKFKDKVPPPRLEEIKNLQALLYSRRKEELTPEIITAMRCPDSDVARQTCVWMHRHFGLIADPQPNKNELHLEPVTKKAVSE